MYRYRYIVAAAAASQQRASASAQRSLHRAATPRAPAPLRKHRGPAPVAAPVACVDGEGPNALGA